jgi:eukaryotic-like serine/threonine-protein kinase
MATPSSVYEFLELVAKSELLEKCRLAETAQSWMDNRTLPSNPKECAATLVKDGLLTPFQAKLLLAGKWKNFYLGGKYKVLDHLGSGGMGAVFLCEHRHMRRRVAVKILPPEKSSAPGSLQRFVREAQAVARLDHPNIVHAHDIDCDAGVYFFVMEFVDGVSLQHLVDSTGPISVARAVNFICQAASGLHHAHQANLVHRDIKPSNLLLDRLGIIKILDLGLARFEKTEDNLTQMLDSKTVLGTADYLAPEQARDSAVDIRADIYSLGALFYYLLIGKPPFDSGNFSQKLIAHQTKAPAPVHSLRADVPEGISKVIAAMLEKDPSKRPQTPNDVTQWLQPWLEEVPPPTPAELPEHRYTHHRDLDTLSRLSTVATMSSAMRSKILQAAAQSGNAQAPATANAQ